MVTLLDNTKYDRPSVKPFYTVARDTFSRFRPHAIVVCKHHGVNPRVWGPCAWRQIHTTAKRYPEHPSQCEREAMKRWLREIHRDIPCPKCQRHYAKAIEQHADELDAIVESRFSVFAFTVYLHNKVNQRNGKGEMSVAHAWTLYE